MPDAKRRPPPKKTSLHLNFLEGFLILWQATPRQSLLGALISKLPAGAFLDFIFPFKSRHPRHRGLLSFSFGSENDRALQMLNQRKFFNARNRMEAQTNPRS
jgi:hypothetical protein